jgi:hypothetical protein
LNNPYTNRPITDAAYFHAERGGRGALAHRLLGQLLRENPLPDAVAILAEKRCGKSSLLGFLYNGLRSHGAACVRLNLLGLSPATPEGFYRDLGREMTLAGLRPDAEMGYRELRDWLRQQHALGGRLVVLLDEFEIVARDYLRFPREFFDNLRTLGNDLPLVFVVATSLPLREIVHAAALGSPFFNIFITERLTLLAPAEAVALIRTPPGGAGVGEHEQELLDLAGRHPYFLQVACRTAWDFRHWHGAVDMPAVRAAFLEKARDEYEAIWDRCQPEEREALCSLFRGYRSVTAGYPALVNRGLVLGDPNPSVASSGLAAFLTDRCPARVAARPLGPCLTPSVALAPMTTDAAAPIMRFALVLGLDYQSVGRPGLTSISPLRYAERDAQAVEALLKSLGFAVYSLIGQRATLDEFRKAFDWLQGNTGGHPNPESCFVFHFSGHGQLGPDDEETAYLMLHDSDPNALPKTAVEMVQLVSHYIPRIRVPNSLVLLDCCHAGSAAGVRDVVAAGHVSHLAQQAFTGVRGRMVLAACAGSARAREEEDLTHGIFTYYVLRHWRDRDGVGPRDAITFGSLVDYVGRSMAAHGRDVPLPVFNGIGMGGTLCLRPVGPDSGR